MPRGFTLIELSVTCAIVALFAAVAVPRTEAALDRLRVDQAARAVATAVHIGRTAAIARGAYTRVVVDEGAGIIRVEGDRDTLLARALRADHRVTLRATRDTITYAPSGLGYGLSNSTIVVAIGERAETVTVSRLGRLRTSW